jgi:hypothetical protein
VTRGKLILVAALALAACSRPTGVRVQMSLESGAPKPDSLAVSVYDRFGGIAYGAQLPDKLPGDLLILVNLDAEMVRVVGIGMVSGTPVVGAASATPIRQGQEMPLPLVLSSDLPQDSDGDGVPDVIDDCPTVYDPDQVNHDGSGPGDACSSDDDPTDMGRPSDLSVRRSGDLAQPNPQADLSPVAPPNCGDGVVQAGEACDNGANNSDDPNVAATCTSMCVKRAACGSLSGSSGAQIDPASGHCYVAWPNQVTWASASRQCESHGGHLVTITSTAEDARVQTLAGAADRWIGLRIDHGQPTRDHWVDGEAVAYSHYASGEPNNGGTSGNPEACGVFEVMRAAWDDRPCGYPSTGMLPASYAYALGYICENECGNGVIEPGESCEGGANCTATCQKERSCSEPGGVVSPVNGHCYFTLSTTATFTDALTACPAGTHLATLDEIAESESAALAVGGSEAWIALMASTAQGSYAWSAGTDFFDSRRYHGFMGAEPNDTGGVPYCARMSPLNGWKDHSCSLLYVPLCERD